MLCRWVPGHSPALHSALLSLLLALLSTEERLWRLQVWSEQRLVSNHPSYLLYRHPTHFIHTSYTFIQTSCTFCTHILHLYIDILQFLGRGVTSKRRFWVYASSFHLPLGQSAWIWLVQCGHPRLWLVERGTIWLSNFITGSELGSQKFLPDMNLALKNSYRTRIRLSNIITRHVTNRKKLK